MIDNHGSSITIDCDHCAVRGIECGDCVVTVLLGGPPQGVRIEPDELEAIDALASSGLVPPLRLVTTEGQDATEMGAYVREGVDYALNPAMDSPEGIDTRAAGG